MTDVATQFPVIDNLIHLNHAAVGPWPRVTADAVREFSEENLYRGSLDYPQWMQTEESLRERLRLLINAKSTDEIALVKSTSEGLSFVASGLDWKEGDNIVGIRQEFPSNRFPWLALAERGVAFRQLDLGQHPEEPERALLELCDENTRLVSVSAVQYADGFRMDLERIGDFCRINNILFCVDAIQQLGAIPFDVRQLKADFVVADGHKWMLAPEGLGVFYVRREVIDHLKPAEYGWHMAEEMSNYGAESFAPAGSARRFECGSPNMVGIHALNASLGLLLEVGIDHVWRQLSGNVRRLREGLGEIPGTRLLGDTSPERQSGILTFRCERIENDALFSRLQQEGIFCASRGGGIRLSPHFYTPVEQLEMLVSLVSKACHQAG